MIAGRFLLVCLGGAAGTAARYLTALWVPTILGTAFPYGTLIVNSVGSFLIALIMQTSSATEIFSPSVRAMLTSGGLGCFATYSTFSYRPSQSVGGRACLRQTVNETIGAGGGPTGCC